MRPGVYFVLASTKEGTLFTAGATVLAFDTEAEAAAGAEHHRKQIEAMHKALRKEKKRNPEFQMPPGSDPKELDWAPVRAAIEAYPSLMFRPLEEQEHGTFAFAVDPEVEWVIGR